MVDAADTTVSEWDAVSSYFSQALLSRGRSGSLKLVFCSITIVDIEAARRSSDGRHFDLGYQPERVADSVSLTHLKMLGSDDASSVSPEAAIFFGISLTYINIPSLIIIAHARMPMTNYSCCQKMHSKRIGSSCLSLRCTLLFLLQY
jgi:hypothetical protein